MDDACQFHNQNNIKEISGAYYCYHQEWKGIRNPKLPGNKKKGFPEWMQEKREQVGAGPLQFPTEDGFFVVSANRTLGIAITPEKLKPRMMAHRLGWFPEKISSIYTPETKAADVPSKRKVKGMHVGSINRSDSSFLVGDEQVKLLANQMACRFPSADPAFTVITYLYDYSNDIKQLLDLDEATYNKAAERTKQSEYDANGSNGCCQHCGHTCAVACYMNEESSQVCCLMCQPKHPKKKYSLQPMVLLAELEKLCKLMDEAKAYSHSFDKEDTFEEYAMGLLDKVEKISDFLYVLDPSLMDSKPTRTAIKNNIRDFYANCSYDTEEYELQDLFPRADISDKEKEKQPIGKMLKALDEGFRKNRILTSQCHDAASHAILISKGFRHDIEFGGTGLHFDPANALNVLSEFAPLKSAKGGGAWWLIVKPTACHDAIGWLKVNDLFQKQLNFDQMRALKEQLPPENAWLLEQKHGQVVRIPVGYAHAVVNKGCNFKVACDVLEKGHLHKSMITWMFLEGKVGPTLTKDYVRVARVATEQLLPALPNTPKKVSKRKHEA